MQMRTRKIGKLSPGRGRMLVGATALSLTIGSGVWTTGAWAKGTSTPTRASVSNLTHLRSSSTGTPPPPGASMQHSGPGEYTIRFEHPAWGPVKLVTHQNSEYSDDGTDPGPAWLTVTDASGVVRFSWRHDFLYEFGPAGTSPYDDPKDRVESPVDSLGHVFLGFNPGRYNGTIVLVPTQRGFDDLRTLPPPDDYDTRFYCTSVLDLDHDGVYEVVSPQYCEGQTYRWRGTDYVAD
jgi:hypothetical protein